MAVISEGGRFLTLRVSTPLQAPRANAYAERLVGSARRECLDWTIITGRRHRERVLGEYVDHYNGQRPHRALQLHPPNGRVLEVCGAGEIKCRASLGGCFAKTRALRLWLLHE